jgi:hypothetical protein
VIAGAKSAGQVLAFEKKELVLSILGVKTALFSMGALGKLGRESRYKSC